MSTRHAFSIYQITVLFIRQAGEIGGNMNHRLDVQERWTFTPIFRYLPIVVMVFIGAAIVGWITRDGVGMSGDSVWYQMGAENILAGNGYMRFSGAGELRPITHFPPFYSLFLAGIGLIGLDLSSIARWSNLILLGLNVVITWKILRMASGSWILADLGAAFLVVNLATLKWYSWLMTEPLFSSLSLLCLYSVLRFANDRHLHNLLLAAVLAGLSVITRLIGYGLILACCGYIVINQHGALRRRLTQSFLFFVISIIPSFIWLVYSSSVGAGTFNRAIIYHPMSIGLMKGYFLFLGDWIQVHRILPGEYRLLLAVFIVITGPLLFLASRIKAQRSGEASLFHVRDSAIWLLMLYSISYGLALFLNSTFIDASTTPYAPERYLTSIYPIFVMLILLTYHRFWTWTKRRRDLALLLSLLAGGIIFLQGDAAWQEISRDRIPLGYTDFIEGHPAFVSRVRESIESHTVYSNNPELTYAISGRGAYILPYKYDSATQEENPTFNQDFKAMQEALSHGAQIVQYGEEDDQELELYTLLDLHIVNSSPEGAIYSAGTIPY